MKKPFSFSLLILSLLGLPSPLLSQDTPPITRLLQQGFEWEREYQYDSLEGLSYQIRALPGARRNDTLQAWADYYLGVFYKSTRLDTAATLLTRAYEEMDGKSRLGSIKSLGNLAGVLIAQGEYEAAIAHYDLALEKVAANLQAFPQSKEFQTLRAKLMVNSALVLKDRGAFEEATSRCIQARSLAAALDLSDVELSAVSTLGGINFALSKWDLGKQYFKQGLALAESRGKPKEVAIMMSNIGMSYIKEDKLDSALQYYHYTLDLAKSQNQPLEYVQRLNNIGLIYFIQKDYEKALLYLEQVAQTSDSLGMKDLHVGALQNLSRIQLSRGKHPAALTYARRALDLSKSRHDKITEYKCYLALSEIYEATGNYEPALQWRHKYATLRDSLINAENMQRIADLQANYEMEKKQQEIDALQRKNEIQGLQLRQRNTLIGILVLVFLLLFIQGFFLLRQRMLREQHKTLEARQQLLRSQMNPHFFFNVLSSIQSFLWEEDPAGNGKGPDFVQRFTRLTRLVLINSREELIPVAQEMETLNLYLSIQQDRFGHRFRFSIHGEKALQPDKHMIPPMWVHPLLEHIIEQRVQGQHTTEELRLSFSIDGDHLWLRLLEVPDTVLRHQGNVAVSANGQLSGLGQTPKESKQVDPRQVFPDHLINRMEERMTLLKKAHKADISFKVFQGGEGEIESICMLPILVRSRSPLSPSG